MQVAVSQGGQKVPVADARSGWTLGLDAVNTILPSRREKGTGPICRLGPEGASHKLDLSPFPFGNDDFQLDAQSVTVTHGGQVKVKVIVPRSLEKEANAHEVS